MSLTEKAARLKAEGAVATLGPNYGLDEREPLDQVGEWIYVITIDGHPVMEGQTVAVNQLTGRARLKPQTESFYDDEGNLK